MKNIKTNWDYSQLAKNYDNRAEYDLTVIKRILKFLNVRKTFQLEILGQGLEN